MTLPSTGSNKSSMRSSIPPQKTAAQMKTLAPHLTALNAIAKNNQANLASGKITASQAAQVSVAASKAYNAHHVAITGYSAAGHGNGIFDASGGQGSVVSPSMTIRANQNSVFDASGGQGSVTPPSLLGRRSSTIVKAPNGSTYQIMANGVGRKING